MRIPVKLAAKGRNCA